MTDFQMKQPNSRVRMFREIFAGSDIKHSVLMASTFRSGSTYVAELLRHNGIAGLGLEKFNTIWEVSVEPDKKFGSAISEIAQTSHDGLLAAKIMWPHRNDLARCLRLERDDSRVLAESFPDAKWIWVKRRDKIRQGISYWRAQKSSRWHVFDDSSEPKLAYDFDEIRECYRELLTHDVCWEDWFVQSEIVPFVIEYESFSTNLNVQLRKLLQFAGVSPRKRLITEVALKKQRDGFTEEIYQHFMKDCYRYG